MAESKMSLATEALTSAGYERLTERMDERTLSLGKGGFVKLILGRDHVIKLSRENDDVVRFSVKDFKLPDLENKQDNKAQAHELKLIAGENIIIERPDEEKLTGIKLEKDKEIDKDTYFIRFPDSAINLHDETIDFTDIEVGANSGFLIEINKPNDNFVISGKSGMSETDDISITIINLDNNFGVAVPVQGESYGSEIAKQDLMAAINRWRLLAASETVENQSQLVDELMAMAGDPGIAEVYDNFMKQEGADKNTAMIAAMAAFLYKDQLNKMGKEKFVEMVKGIKTAIAIGS